MRNDRFDVVLENVKEKNSGDKTEGRAETDNNEVEQGHTGVPSLVQNIPFVTTFPMIISLHSS